MNLEIHLRLKSDTTFGRGDGVAGLVDTEVEHDEYGLPFLRGRTLKGLLVEESANLLYALEQSQPATVVKRFERAARCLFGQAGSSLHDDALMHVGAAMLPNMLREALKADVVKKDGLQAEEVLESLTAIRRQTAVSEKTSAPEKNSLRSMHVILRETPFVARLSISTDSRVGPDDLNDMKAFLAACVLSLRRAGTGRNRGRGRLKATLHDETGEHITSECFNRFSSAPAATKEATE